MDDMDILDRKILCELDLNCRQPAAKIAKKVGSSRAVVGYRIKSLEKEGIIKSYFTAINLGRLGFSTYKIYFKLYNLNDKAEKEFYAYLAKSEQTIHCLKVEGAFDASIVVAVRSVAELDSFLTGLKNNFSPIIKDYQLSLVVGSKVFKISKIIFGKEAKEPKIEKFSGVKEQAFISENDKKIHLVIAYEANLPIVEIARRAKLSVDIVKYRLKKLEQQGVINTFRLLLDMEKIGIYHYVILVRTRRATKEDESMINFWCTMHPAVMYITKRIGSWDYELNVAVKSIREFSGFVDAMRKQFPEIIESYDTIINTKVMKLNYLPLSIGQ